MVRIRRGVSLLALGVTVLGVSLVSPLAPGKAAEAAHVSTSLVNPLGETSTLANLQQSLDFPMLAAPAESDQNSALPLRSSQGTNGEVQPSFHLNNLDALQELRPDQNTNLCSANQVQASTQSGTQEAPRIKTTNPSSVQALQPLQPDIQGQPAFQPAMTSAQQAADQFGSPTDSGITQPDTNQNQQSGQPGTGQDQQNGDTQTQQPDQTNGTQAQQTPGSTSTDQNQDATQTQPATPSDPNALQTSSGPSANDQNGTQAQGQTQLGDGSDTFFGITGPFSASISWGDSANANGATASNSNTKSVSATLMIADTNNQDSSDQLSIDWGDGTTAKQMIGKDLLNKSFQVSGMHEYHTSGTYQVTLTLLDNNGNQVSSTRTFVIP